MEKPGRVIMARFSSNVVGVMGSIMAMSVAVRSRMKRARALLEAGQVVEAQALCARICQQDKLNAEAWLMLGVASKALGRVDEALRALDKATALSPGDSFSQNEKGLLLAQTGRYAEAVIAFEHALPGAPVPATVQLNLGVVYGLMGQYDAALQAFDRVLRADPRSAAVYIQRSAVLHLMGQHEAALHAAEQALSLNRYSLEANIRISEALVGLARYEEALAGYSACLSIDPDHLPSQRRVIELCRGLTVRTPTAAHLAVLERAYTWAHVNAQDLARFAASVFKANGLHDMLDAALVDAGQSLERGLESLRALATAHRLYFDGLLAQGVLEDAQLERATTTFRARLLHFLWAHRTAFDVGIPAPVELLLHGLSRQCFNNESLWGSTEGEDILVAQCVAEVEARLQASSGLDPALALRFWLLALYRPLSAVIPEHLGNTITRGVASPYLKQVLQTQCTEYWEEQRIKAEIRPLTPIAEGVSSEVRNQYEENPYPRWQSLPPVEPGSATESLGGLFADGAIPDYLGQPMEILIAGCGTGRHSIQTARRFPASRVTAIDLSRASLAYAARKTAELNIENVAYFQADIMALGALEQRFHIVESIGVLHHLEDPAAGWRVLTSLLAPGGLMHIALYSRIARTRLDFARNAIKQAGRGNDAASIRAFRKQVLSASPGTELAEVASFGRDFYSLSNCRDLLFHVQEHQFTLVQIAALLEALGLEFLGLELDPWVVEAYSRFNPADLNGTDLESWHRFELENPLTFAGMYQFWCRKR